MTYGKANILRADFYVTYSIFGKRPMVFSPNQMLFLQENGQCHCSVDILRILWQRKMKRKATNKETDKVSERKNKITKKKYTVEQSPYGMQLWYS